MLLHVHCTVSARFIYGFTTTQDSSATIHHGGATNTHDASTIRYDASTIQAGSATVASRPPTNLHDLAVVMRESQGGRGYSHFFFICRLGSSICRSPPPPPPPTKKKKKKKKNQEFLAPQKIFEILATQKISPILYLDLKKKTQKMHRNDP